MEWGKIGAFGGILLAALSCGAPAQKFNLNQIAPQAANTVIGNFTGGSANLTAQVVSACNVLKWTAGAGIMCSVTTFGTGVATALGVNVGSAGAPVVFNGALGTPSSGTGTNITGVNAAQLGGATFAGPGAIGSGSPAAGTFTALVAGTKFTMSSGGAAATVGNATLVGGTVTVNTTAALAGSFIMLTRKTIGGTVGDNSYTISAGTSFTINSTSGTDTSTFTWMIVN